AFLRPLLAERALEIRIKPFRIIAAYMRRRVLDIRGVEPRALTVSERLRRVARSVGELRDLVGREAPLALEHAEQNRARRLGAHQPGAGGAAASRAPGVMAERAGCAR